MCLHCLMSVFPYVFPIVSWLQTLERQDYISFVQITHMVAANQAWQTAVTFTICLLNDE